jgi:2-polyprenyl-3-methyl-5-hydroxy-6-metoxy-1,4-benzoquinol methylase
MDAAQEIAAGKRFGFGENWARFLGALDDARIAEAEASLKHMLGVADLRGKRFLDVGCGSGLFSLAARRLGASVVSCDFDPQSVACAQELRRRFFSRDPDWRIELGSVLDRSYMASLGEFDVVYSWGVLHHTGAMWVGLENAIGCVERRAGKLFIAIYNDQGWKSHAWWFVKLLYNRTPRFLRPAFIALTSFANHALIIAKYTLKLQPMVALKPLFRDRRERGMSAKYDKVDWIGGFPFEFASFEVLRQYLEARGFALIGSIRNSTNGCNEIAVQRVAREERAEVPECAD